MRRYIGIILFALVLLVPILLRAVLSKHARQETFSQDTPRLVIITPHDQDIRNEFRWAFEQWHQKKYGRPVQLEFLTPGGTNDIFRQLDTTYQAIRSHHDGKLPPESQIQNGGIDVVWGGGDYFFNNKLKPLGVLHPIGIDPNLIAQAFPQPTLAGVRLYDRDFDSSGHLLPPKWIGICLSSFGIVYNPDLYHSLGLPAPTTWNDLTQQKLSGYIALADPSHSSSASVAYMIILQRAMADAENRFFNQQPKGSSLSQADLKKTPAYQQALSEGWKAGMRELLLIAANARYFSDSSAQPPNDVSSGDAAAGMVIDFYGRVTEQTVGPARCQFILPYAATAIAPDPVGILYGTTGKQLELANHFIEFLLSKPGQLLWIEKTGQPDGPRLRNLHRAPIRRDVYADRTGWADDMDYFQQSGNFNQRGEWMAQMTDLQPLWAAAWIDDRDDLRRAYAAVLAVPDAQRRAKLIFQLSDLPVSMADVNQLAIDRKRVESDPHGDSNQWKAQNRIQWARKFRDHYNDVLIQAGQ